MYGINEAIAAKEERRADRKINPFLSEANSIQRASPVFDFVFLDFVLDIARYLLNTIMAQLAISNYAIIVSFLVSYFYSVSLRIDQK